MSFADADSVEIVRQCR